MLSSMVMKTSWNYSDEVNDGILDISCRYLVEIKIFCDILCFHEIFVMTFKYFDSAALVWKVFGAKIQIRETANRNLNFTWNGSVTVRENHIRTCAQKLSSYFPDFAKFVIWWFPSFLITAQWSIWLEISLIIE